MTTKRDEAQQHLNQADILRLIEDLGNLGTDENARENTAAALNELLETETETFADILSKSMKKKKIAQQIESNLHKAFSHKNASSSVRYVALRILGIITTPKNTLWLGMVINDKNPDIRIIAAQMLGATGDIEALQHLSRALANISQVQGEKAQEEREVINSAIAQIKFVCWFCETNAPDKEATVHVTRTRETTQHTYRKQTTTKRSVTIPIPRCNFCKEYHSKRSKKSFRDYIMIAGWLSFLTLPLLSFFAFRALTDASLLVQISIPSFIFLLVVIMFLVQGYLRNKEGYVGLRTIIQTIFVTIYTTASIILVLLLSGVNQILIIVVAFFVALFTFIVDFWVVYNELGHLEKIDKEAKKKLGFVPKSFDDRHNHPKVKEVMKTL